MAKLLTRYKTTTFLFLPNFKYIVSFKEKLTWRYTLKNRLPD